MSQISIMGCGWLGFPLAVSLLRKGYSINGSTTSTGKKDDLSAAGIQPFLIQLKVEGIIGEVNHFLEGSKILIINVPPGMRGDSSDLFSSKIKNLLPLIVKSGIENVLFVSSTSVFGDLQGVVNESTVPHPETLSGKDLLKTEQLLMANTNFKTTILRFGGLIGDDRHPVNFLSGRTQLKGGNAPVNLIHQKDCIGIIANVIKNSAWGMVFHGVFPEHPNKKEYYSKKAIEFSLSPPEFLEDESKNYKVVMSKTIEAYLNYQFQEKI